MTTKSRIENAFNLPVTVLEFGTPRGQGPVGLVKQQDESFCVVELDDDGFADIFHDYAPAEEYLARSHYSELGVSPARDTEDMRLHREMYGEDPHADLAPIEIEEALDFSDF